MVSLLWLSSAANAAPAAYVVDHSQSSQSRLRPLPLEAVEWTTGFWADRYRQLCEVTLEESWRLLADPAAGHVLDNFRFAAKPGSGQLPRHDLAGRSGSTNGSKPPRASGASIATRAGPADG